MIFNTYEKNQTRNTKKLEPIKNYSSLTNKTRIESLNERIHNANELINSFVEKAITEKFEEKKLDQIPKEKINNNQMPSLNDMIKSDNIINNSSTLNTNKSVQVNESNIIKENTENNNIEEKKENVNIENNIENNNETQKINENNNIEKKEEIPIKEQNEEKRGEKEENIDIPFLKRTKLLLMELKKLREKSLIKEEDINKEIVSELPKRSLLEMSLSDLRSKKNYEKLKKKITEKDKYIKELELEIYNQKKENIRLKKSENENLLKISALEDELRVFKSKFMKYYSQTENNSPQEYGEKLVRSMWVRDNMMENKNENINDIDNNSNSNMTFNNRSNINNLRNKNTNSFYKNKWGSPWNSQSYRNLNNNDSMNLNNNFNNYNGGQSNFQRVSGMILDNNKTNRIRLNKNYGNEVNRYKNGNYYNNKKNF